MKKVYVSLIADLLHAGHVKILKEAEKYGEITIGLLTSSSVNELNDTVYLKYQQRLEVLQNLSMVSQVIPQDSASYKDNLFKLKPDFVVHGNDWTNNRQSKYRKEVVEILSEWDGKLIEIEYSSDISDQNIKNQLMKLGVTTVHRLGRLRQLIKKKPIVLILEAHNALSGLIAENTEVVRNGKLVSFDGIWSSSLTDSTAKGKPDIEAIDITSRINAVNDIFEVTIKPMIFDADTGGKTEHFEFTVRSLERVGVSAVVIEDKTGLKKNSLFGNDVKQTQDSVENFCDKIQKGKKAQISDDFMIIARIESLILEAGMDDALIRAEHWVVVSGVATVTNGNQNMTLTQGQSTYIPLKTVYCLENQTDEHLEIIKVQSGEYLGEDDMASASLFVLELDKQTYQDNTQPMLSHINVGTGKDVTIREMEETMKKVVGYKGNLAFDTAKSDGVLRKLINVSRLSSMGCKYSTDLVEGLKKTYKYYLKQAEIQ